MMVALLLIFFAWMVIQTRISQSKLRRQSAAHNSVPAIHDFKSSASTFLFHGVSRETLQQEESVGISNQEKELENRAEELTVRFLATQQEWKLTAVNP